MRLPKKVKTTPPLEPPPCMASAPVVANGGAFLACHEPLGHHPNTPHKIIVTWEK